MNMSGTLAKFSLLGVIVFGAAGCSVSSAEYPLRSELITNVSYNEPFYKSEPLHEDDYYADDYYEDEYYERDYRRRDYDYRSRAYEDDAYHTPKMKKRLKPKRLQKRKKAAARPRSAVKKRLVKTKRTVQPPVKRNTTGHFYEGKEEFCSQGKYDCNGFVNER